MHHRPAVAETEAERWSQGASCGETLQKQTLLCARVSERDQRVSASGESGDCAKRSSECDRISFFHLSVHRWFGGNGQTQLWRCLQSCSEGVCSLVLVTEHLPKLWIVCVKQGWSEKSGFRASASCCRHALAADVLKQYFCIERGGNGGWGGEGRERGRFLRVCMFEREVLWQESLVGRSQKPWRGVVQKTCRQISLPACGEMRWGMCPYSVLVWYIYTAREVMLLQVHKCTAHGAVCVTYHIQLITVTHTVECKSNISKERSHRDFLLLVLPYWNIEWTYNWSSNPFRNKAFCLLKYCMWKMLCVWRLATFTENVMCLKVGNILLLFHFFYYCVQQYHLKYMLRIPACRFCVGIRVDVSSVIFNNLWRGIGKAAHAKKALMPELPLLRAVAGFQCVSQKRYSWFSLENVLLLRIIFTSIKNHVSLVLVLLWWQHCFYNQRVKIWNIFVCVHVKAFTFFSSAYFHHYNVVGLLAKVFLTLCVCVCVWIFDINLNTLSFLLS